MGLPVRNMASNQISLPLHNSHFHMPKIFKNNLTLASASQFQVSQDFPKKIPDEKSYQKEIQGKEDKKRNGINLLEILLIQCKLTPKKSSLERETFFCFKHLSDVLSCANTP